MSVAQRKLTDRILPDWRVEGATPASPARPSGVGKRARQSPISDSSRAARTVPERGRLVNMWKELQADRTVQVSEQPDGGGQRVCPARSLQARQVARSVTVVGPSGIKARSRAWSVRSVSAST